MLVRWVSWLRISLGLNGCTPLALARINQVRSQHGGSYLGDALATDGSIDTVPLAYEVHEPKHKPAVEKSPVLMIHGLFGSRANSRTVAKSLAQELDRSIYCLDLRNFGQSPHIDRLDYPSLAADVERFVTEHLKQKPILVGHSMGAKTVMAVALRNPQLPKMIVAVDNAPVDLAGLAGAFSTFSKYVNQLRLALEKYKYKDINDVDAKLAEVEKSQVVRLFLLMNLKRGRKDEPVTSKIPLDIIGKAINTGKIAAWPYDLNVSRWCGPALFIRGTESQYIPDDVIPDIGKYFPDFEVRDIKSGHWVISEKPQEFKKVLMDWIERKEDE
jgi:pimeloyl-ACP methyl ester carboxylesterase